MEKLSYYFAKFIFVIATPKALKNCKLHKTAKVCSGTTLNDVSMGRYSYIGHYCRINNCQIGNFTSIASDCVIGGSSHPISWISTSPVFHTRNNIFGKSFAKKIYSTSVKTNIGNDVWIGSNVLVKAGVNIENGAVVGMGSVVTKDVGAYEIWAGSPARKIRSRFPEEVADKLNSSKWWEMNEQELEKMASIIDTPEVFVHLEKEAEQTN